MARRGYTVTPHYLLPKDEFDCYVKQNREKPVSSANMDVFQTRKLTDKGLHEVLALKPLAKFPIPCTRKITCFVIRLLLQQTVQDRCDLS